MSSKIYPSFIPIYKYMISGFSPAAGLKSGQFDRKRNFGNVVSSEVVTKK
jgi:hypothetical protein